MVKLGEKSICLLCKQVACVKMSPAEDWDGGNVYLHHTWMPKLGLFLCVSLCQEAKTSFFYDFSPWLSFSHQQFLHLLPGRMGSFRCLSQALGHIGFSSVWQGLCACVFPRPTQYKSPGSLKGILEGIPTLFVAWQAQYYS